MWMENVERVCRSRTTKRMLESDYTIFWGFEMQIRWVRNSRFFVSTLNTHIIYILWLKEKKCQEPTLEVEVVSVFEVLVVFHYDILHGVKWAIVLPDAPFVTDTPRQWGRAIIRLTSRSLIPAVAAFSSGNGVDNLITCWINNSCDSGLSRDTKRNQIFWRIWTLCASW